MNPLEAYLHHLAAVRASGAGLPELSGYAALANLINAVGGSLKPRVTCVMGLKDQGAGFPDGGLFTADQLQRVPEGKPILSLLPALGVLEVKPPADDAWLTADSRQVSRYWETYRKVLVTNYRDFLLVGEDAEGNPVKLESFRLAPDQQGFWEAAAHPRRTDAQMGERFLEYLRRVILHLAPLASPEELARLLASYARDARLRLQGAELPALAAVRTALEETLGIQFQGERGDHFFRSTLVQTLFYGVFSAWVLWCERHPAAGDSDRFRWRETPWYLNVPMIRSLFHQVATPDRLGPLGLVELLDWTEGALNRVNRFSFFARFHQSYAVQYFYEPFLEAFDPELRRELGVWYTPPEIVKYMVARVDRVLRDELGIEDGLADPRVVVLDPCCGTGAYLVEVLNRIAETTRDRGQGALASQAVKLAARERVFGFEILPAPFVIAHWQVGMLLQQLGAPLASETERAGVYLTNALTGWEPPDPNKERLVQARLAAMPELQSERDAAGRVKRDAPILVVLGNPPYNGFAGMAVEEERELSNACRTTKRAAPPQGKGLNDLYVRFFRMAERRITQGSEGQGVVCFISNYSWLDGLSFTGMRERYLEVFDRIWIDNLHGDRIISEYAPDGRTSETIFSMKGRSPGIRIGTNISLLCAYGHKRRSNVEQTLMYRDFFEARAEDRRAALLASVSESQESGADGYTVVAPAVQVGFPFCLRTLTTAYLTWPSLPELFPASSPGVMTSRDALVVDFDRNRLMSRMGRYFDREVSDEEVGRMAPVAMDRTGRFDPHAVRAALLDRGFLPLQVVRYAYRPFDVRWVYWEPETKLLDEKRSAYFPYAFSGNGSLVAQQKPRRLWSPPQVIRHLGCLDLMDRGASCFPMLLPPPSPDGGLLPCGQTDPSLWPDGRVPNLSEKAGSYVARLGVTTHPEAIFHHSVAILHSSAYRQENEGGLRQDWPRVPLPSQADDLLASAALGRELAALLDPEQPVKGVTTGSLRPELKAIAVASRAGGRPLNPDAGDLEVTAGWGHAGKGGVTMPGQGRFVARPYTPEETAAIHAGAAALGLSPEEALGLLGPDTRDIYLNGVAFWSNVPSRVWSYTLGGYQVIKKWLSYREKPLLGRSLTTEEMLEVSSIARRIAAILLLEPKLDENYLRAGSCCYPWPSSHRTSWNDK